MAGMKMTLAAAGLSAALAGSPEQVDAQATILSIPHPEGAQLYEVAELSLETQQQIMDILLQCLKDEFDAANENGNETLDNDDEKEFYKEGQVFCAESAGRNIRIAINRVRAADAERRIANAKRQMNVIGDEIIKDLQSGL